MKNKRCGFTLIELMIVVAIIGILAAVAIPKFAELTRQADKAANNEPAYTVTVFNDNGTIRNTYRARRYDKMDDGIHIRLMDDSVVTVTGSVEIKETK